jgi:hypothetical protein
MSPLLTVFSNFYIDSEERFLRCIDSFESMQELSVFKYIVNVRGQYAVRTIERLKRLNPNIDATTINSGDGWFVDSQKLLDKIETKYVLLWLEDHICMDPKSVNGVVLSMDDVDADILTYSFWCNGHMLERYREVSQNNLELIKWFDHTIQANEVIQQSKWKSYIVSCTSIIKKELFVKIIKDGGSEKRWPKETPFDFEKGPFDIKWLPIRRAAPKLELFASIDDDLSCPGSCLQKRGLYPVREGRSSYANQGFLQKLRRFKKIFARFERKIP